MAKVVRAFVVGVALDRPLNLVSDERDRVSGGCLHPTVVFGLAVSCSGIFNLT